MDEDMKMVTKAEFVDMWLDDLLVEKVIFVSRFMTDDGREKIREVYLIRGLFYVMEWTSSGVPTVMSDLVNQGEFTFARVVPYTKTSTDYRMVEIIND
jgi:hypothetical protein